MSVLFDHTPQIHQSHYLKQRDMTVSSHYDHFKSSYGLITPPSEMRTTAIASDNNPMDPNNILVPSSTSRYYLRKQQPPQSMYPAVGNNGYQPNNYNSYIHGRRRSGSSSTSVTTSTTSTVARPRSPPLDLDSRIFNLGDFTATMVCFLWFEPIAILDYAESYHELTSQLHPLSDDSIAANDFIEFCTRVIRATAVSKEVALLGLLYIYRLRLRNPSVDGKSGSQWRIFTISLMLGNKILDDNTYTNKTWADVTKILDVTDIKIMEVEFLSQMRYNLFVSPQEWEEWKSTLSRMYSYHRDALRQRSLPKKIYSGIPPSPPVSTAATSPSFSEPPQYLSMSGSPFRMQFPSAPISDRMSSPHRAIPPMDDSPSSASAAVHARVSRKRSREENSVPSGLQPPAKRIQQYHAGPLGIQIPLPQQQSRMPYPTETMQHHLQQYQQQAMPQNRASLSLALPDPSQAPSQSYIHQYPLPASPSFPTSPYAASPLSPYSTASNYTSLSPYASIPHRQMQSTPQPMESQQATPSGYASGFSSPYKYLENRFSPYAPVRPVRTLPSQFVPPRMQWSALPQSTEELWYQPLGLHGHSGLRRGIPTYTEYNPGYQQYPQPQNQNQGR